MHLGKKFKRRILSSMLAVAMVFNTIPLDNLTLRASAVESSTNTLPIDGEDVVGQAARALGVKYHWGYKGTTAPYNDLTGWGRVKGQGDIASDGLDCSGLVHWSLSADGLRSKGYVLNSPVPADVVDWNYKDEYHSLNNGDVVQWWKEDSAGNKSDITDVTLNSVRRYVTDGQYWIQADGTELNPGAIVLASNNADGKSNNGDHAWIYLGDFKDRDAVISYVSKVSGLSESTVERYTGKQYGNCTHWRIEASGGSTERPDGTVVKECVMIDNGTGTKTQSRYYASTLDVHGNSTYSFRKVDKHTNRVILGYTNPDPMYAGTADDGSQLVWAIYDDYKAASSASLDGQGYPTNDPVDWMRVSSVAQGNHGTWSRDLPRNKTYYLRELSAPVGYEINNDVITLVENSTVDLKEDRTTGSMTLSKGFKGTASEKWCGTVTLHIESHPYNSWDKFADISKDVTINVVNGKGTAKVKDLPVYGLDTTRGGDNFADKLKYTVTETSCTPAPGYEQCDLTLDKSTKTIYLADCTGFEYVNALTTDFTNEADEPVLVTWKRFKDKDGQYLTYDEANDAEFRGTTKNLEVTFRLYKAGTNDTPDLSQCVKAVLEDDFDSGLYNFVKFEKDYNNPFFESDITEFEPRKLPVTNFNYGTDYYFRLNGLPFGRYVLVETSNSNKFTKTENLVFDYTGDSNIVVTNEELSEDASVSKVFEDNLNIKYDADALAKLYDKTEIVCARAGTRDTGLNTSNIKYSDYMCVKMVDNGVYEFEKWNTSPSYTHGSIMTPCTDKDSPNFGSVIVKGIPKVEGDPDDSYCLFWSEGVQDEPGAVIGADTPTIPYGITPVNSTAKVLPNNKGKYSSATLVNKFASFDVSIVKVEKKNHNVAIAGARYGLYARQNVTVCGVTLWKKDELISTAVTNPNSPTKFNSTLPVVDDKGTVLRYYIKEIEAPDGYYLDTEEHEVTAYANKTVTVTCDEEAVSYVVSKYGTSNKLIAGAKMELRSINGTVLESWTTEADKTYTIKTKLKSGGIYILHEEEAPTGYYPAEDIRFTVPTSVPKENPVKLSMVDREINVEVAKTGYDSLTLQTTDNLPGAVLEVRDSENALIDSWTSTADGKHKLPASKLKAGATYTLKEIQAPDGYFKAADIKFTVPSVYTATKTVSMLDEYIYADLYKTSELTGESLAGATMHIYDKATGEEIDKWVSDGSVHKIHDGLVKGHTYVYEEVTAPDGYVKSNEKVEIVVPETYKPLSGTIVNKPTELDISKIDDGKYGVVLAVKDAKLAIYELKDNDELGTKIDEWVTDGSTHIVKGKLKAGHKYLLCELEVPDGYVKADDIKVIINTDGSVNTVDMVDSKMSVDVYKTGEDNKPLVGATLAVYDETKDRLADSWTTDGKKHTVLNVVSGHTYVLKEVKAPKGYQVSPDTRFNFDANGVISLVNDSDENTWATIKVANEEEANQLTLVDKKTVWEFEKIDKNGNPVKDCEFELRDSDGNVLKTWVSDDNTFKIVGELEAGLEYTVHENKAKDGWNLAADINFTVKGITSSEYGEVTITKMTDVPTYVKFSKRDLTGQEELPGATLVVYDSEGNEIERWVSGATPHEVIAKYKAGATYRIHEETTPHGYAYTSDSTFTVSTDGRVDEVVVNDDFTKVSVLKVDKDTREPISGAHISLYKTADLESDNAEPVLTWVTDGTAKRIDKICDVGVPYTIIETSAPNGYVVMEKYEFTLDEDYDGKVIEVVLEDDYTKVVIDKEEVTTEDEDETGEVHASNSIIGATLRVEDMDGNVVDEWVTDGTAHHIEKKLVAGQSYKLIETFAPDGYVISEEIIFTVNADGSINHIVMKDDYTKVEVTKIGKNSVGATSPLSGATLQLLDSEGNVIDEWETNGAMHPFYRKLKAGATYTIHETKAPKGYSLSPDITFTVNTDGTVNGIDVVDETTKVGISKVSENKQNVKTPLAGAVLQVLEVPESADTEPVVVLEWTTDGSGYKLLEGVLEQGKTYILHEVSAPKGYIKADDITFTVPVTGQLAKVEMVDKTTTVRVRKLDEDGNIVQGAQLQLVDMYGNVVEEWETDAEWHVIDGVLEDGLHYTIHEESAPNGYIMSTDIEIEVSLDGRIDSFDMVDKYTKVKFSKKSMSGEDELPGATMVVYDSEGNEIERWVSTTEPHYVIATYIAGAKYRLHEEVAPTGYVLAPDVEFTVSEDGSVDTVVMRDDTTKVSVDKTSITDGKPVIGAVIKIVDSEGNVLTEWTTDGKEHRIDGILEAGKTYKLVETYAPDGYVIADSVEFRVLETGEILRVHMIDDVTKVRLYKRDMTDDSELSGARLQVIDSEGNVVDEWTSDGRVHELNGKLKAGAKYRLHEVSAPDGYLVSDDVEFTVNADGTVTTVVMKDAKKPVTETPKTPNTPNTGGDAPSVTNTDKIAVEEDGVKVEEPEADIAKASASVSHTGLTSGTSTAVCGITFCGTFLVCLYLLRRRRKFQTK